MRKLLLGAALIATAAIACTNHALTRHATPKVTTPTATPTAAPARDIPKQTILLHASGPHLEDLMPTYTDLVAALEQGAARAWVQAGTDETPLRELETTTRADFGWLEGPPHMTCWARDPYVVFERLGKTTVLLPRTDPDDDERHGDIEIGASLGEQFLNVEVIQTPIVLEGGNVLIGERHVLIGYDVVADNGCEDPGQVSELLADLGQLFQRRVVVLGSASHSMPHVHIDMFCTLLSGNAVVLADPLLTLGYFERCTELGLDNVIFADLGYMDQSMQYEFRNSYAEIERQLRSAGFRVHRIAGVHTSDDNMLTWNNVVFIGNKTVCVPTYEIPYLDRLALKAWRNLGFETKRVRCRAIIGSGGALRCVTNCIPGLPAESRGR